ncbi:MAG: hypothetical protein AAGB10_22080 [Pseudomonadota bacterium]
MLFRRRWLAFLAIYALLSVAAGFTAPLVGRVPLSCFDQTLRMQSWFYCVLNRHYVVPDLADVLADASAAMARQHPGTETLILDAGFPFLDGFPLLPHLSHDDGRKADLAFYYKKGGDVLPGRTRSPIGYFAFEDGPTSCSAEWGSLRWSFHWLQPLWPDWSVDRMRMRSIMQILIQDQRVGKILLEPHLVKAWNVAGPKVRFQGCGAARHDDHIHIQL